MKPANIMLAVFLVLAALSASPAAGPPRQGVRLGDGVRTGDLVLYREIDAAVARGESYYHAAARLHRQRGYPLRPFFTVRPPTLAWLYALAGPVALLAAAVALIAATALIWFRRLSGEPRAVRLGAVAIVSLFGAAGLGPQILGAHEWWGGLLLSAALGLDRKGEFAARLALATCAALVRELAAPFLALMFAAEICRRDYRRAAAVGAVLAFLAVLLALHRAAVGRVVQPFDLATQGWLGLRGIHGFAADIGMLTGLDQLWLALATFLALAPLAGWLHHARDGGWFPLCWFAGFAGVIAIAARTDNFYWAQLLLPAYLVGWALLFPLFAEWASMLPGWRHIARKNAGTKASPTK